MTEYLLDRILFYLNLARERRDIHLFGEMYLFFLYFILNLVNVVIDLQLNLSIRSSGL